jgi:hypothetical protein
MLTGNGGIDLKSQLLRRILGLRLALVKSKKLGRLYPKNKLSVVVHVCNPSYLGGRGRKIAV